jgi:hypothetical protein
MVSPRMPISLANGLTRTNFIIHFGAIDGVGGNQ